MGTRVLSRLHGIFSHKLKEMPRMMNRIQAAFFHLYWELGASVRDTIFA
ncbi:hypothetical protein TIFTF001_053466 [Ficus carica]|uniref:Uncharacterized protein n=1 Tax=Ficus carica TaxID=3494 RepID=A0AA88JCN1_FICCA|nr:hypothetical protein TIFTF001_053466 [Ficus carica]